MHCQIELLKRYKPQDFNELCVATFGEPRVEVRGLGHMWPVKPVFGPDGGGVILSCRAMNALSDRAFQALQTTGFLQILRGHVWRDTRQSAWFGPNVAGQTGF